MSPHSTAGDTLKDLCHIRLYYDTANSYSSALKLVFALYPHWQHEKGDVEFVRFTDGITNTLLKAIKRRPGYTEAQIDEAAVLLRAYGKGTEVLIDRERETTSHCLLAQYHLAPPLLARFDNGLMYKFIQGCVCTSKDLARTSVRQSVARKLGEWHSVLPVTSSTDSNRTSHWEEAPYSLDPFAVVPPFDRKIHSITLGKTDPNLWTVLQKWILALPKETEQETKRNVVLQKELERTMIELGNLPGLGKGGLVFGHCDLLSGNIIVRPHPSDQPSNISPVSFIDYEYATPVPAAFDIANHFAEWGGFGCDYNALPTRSQRRGFIADYLDSYCSFHPNFGTQTDLCMLNKQLVEDVDRFRGVPGFYWGIWALIQATISQIDFDYASYAETRLGEYWAWRAEEDGSRAMRGQEIPLREKRWAEE